LGKKKKHAPEQSKASGKRRKKHFVGEKTFRDEKGLLVTRRAKKRRKG